MDTINPSMLLVSQLRVELRKRELSTTGNKRELIDRLSKHLLLMKKKNNNNNRKKENEEEEEEEEDKENNNKPKTNNLDSDTSETHSSNDEDNSDNSDDSDDDDDDDDDDVTNCFSKLSINSNKPSTSSTTTKTVQFQPITQNIKEKKINKKKNEQEEIIYQSEEEYDDSEEEEDIKYTHQDTCYEKVIPLDEKKENRCLELDSSTILRLSSNLLPNDNETILTLPSKKMMARILKDLRKHTFTCVWKCAKHQNRYRKVDGHKTMVPSSPSSPESLLIDSIIIRDCARDCYGNGGDLVSKIIQKWNTHSSPIALSSFHDQSTKSTTLINRWSIVNHADNFFNAKNTNTKTVNITYEAYLFMSIAIEVVMINLYNDILINSPTKDIGLKTLKSLLVNEKYEHIFKHFDYTDFHEYAWNSNISSSSSS